MIHIIRVKLGTSFHLLMPESKPMLSPSEQQISFFLRDLSSASTCSPKGCDNFCEAPTGEFPWSCHIAIKWLWPLRMVRTRTKMCLRMSDFGLHFFLPQSFYFLILFLFQGMSAVGPREEGK